MKLTSIQTGTFKLDGGAMFGVVPKRMWSKLNPPDEQNMCTWAMRALLVQTGTRTILIDTGIGNKQDAKWRSFFYPEGENGLFEGLARAGVQRADVTDVFLTHLHFDHCGGRALENEQTGAVEPAFPNAVYWSNERHFQWAMSPNEREKASFLKENFAPLYEQGRMQFIEVRQQVLFDKNFRVRFVYGHTEAMMMPVIQVGSKKVIYCADLLPSQWHIGPPYVMAYDIRPLLTMAEKKRILHDAAAKGHILMLEHDPFAACCTVRFDEPGRVVLDRAGRLDEMLE